MSAAAVDSSPTQKDIPVVPDPRVRYVSARRKGSTYVVPIPKQPKSN